MSLASLEIFQEIGEAKTEENGLIKQKEGREELLVKIQQLKKNNLTAKEISELEETEEKFARNFTEICWRCEGLSAKQLLKEFDEKGIVELKKLVSEKIDFATNAIRGLPYFAGTLSAISFLSGIFYSDPFFSGNLSGFLLLISLFGVIVTLVSVVCRSSSLFYQYSLNVRYIKKVCGPDYFPYKSLRGHLVDIVDRPYSKGGMK